MQPATDPAPSPQNAPQAQTVQAGSSDERIRNLERQIQGLGPISFSGDVRLRAEPFFGGPTNESLDRVRGRGLLLALNLQSEIGPQVVGLALQRGLLINAPRTDTLRFMPALTVTRQEIDRMIAILGEVLKEFSIATECGFGRRPAETIPQLLRIHAEIAASP